jgi:hypothetical protein
MKEKDKFDEIVSNALENVSGFELSPDFADRVVGMVHKKVIQREAKRDRWWLVTGIVSLIAVFAFAFTRIKFTASVGVFTFVQSYWGLVVFGILFVTALHIIDKRIISHR